MCQSNYKVIVDTLLTNNHQIFFNNQESIMILLCLILFVCFINGVTNFLIFIKT